MGLEQEYATLDCVPEFLKGYHLSRHHFPREELDEVWFFEVVAKHYLVVTQGDRGNLEVGIIRQLLHEVDGLVELDVMASFQEEVLVQVENAYVCLGEDTEHELLLEQR